MTPYRVHVVYEHGDDGRPFSSSHIRLLRPLSHSSVAAWVQLSSATGLCDDQVDLVAVDRLWHKDVSGEEAEALVDEVRRRGARLLYSLDDDLITVVNRFEDDPAGRRKRAALDLFLRKADRVIVTTWPLYQLVREFNSCVSVVPNYLDDRLLPYPVLGSVELYRRRLARNRCSPDSPIVIGQMGTRTHDDDLTLIVPALRAVCRRHPDRILLEIVGTIDRASTWSLLHGLPCRELRPGSLFTEYPSFVPWFRDTCRWNIGLAPLADTSFNNYKSDVKFLDYASLGAAGVFSRVLPYERVVQHGVTGWLVENTADAWETALEHLVTHPTQAMTIGWLAQRYLRQHRTLAQGSALWLNAIRLTMTQDRREQASQSLDHDHHPRQER